MKIAKRTETVMTKYGAFKVAFESEPDMGGYATQAITVPSAISWGKNLVEARRMAAESIECAIEGEVLLEAERAGRITVRRQRIVSQLA